MMTLVVLQNNAAALSRSSPGVPAVAARGMFSKAPPQDSLVKNRTGPINVHLLDLHPAAGLVKPDRQHSRARQALHGAEMFCLMGIPLKKTPGLSDTEFDVLKGTPALTGSLIRVPPGISTDIFGGREVIVPAIAVSGIVAPAVDG